jgi:hypothetical protein
MSGQISAYECNASLIFGNTECVGSRFHILRAQTHFQRYQGRRVPFSCFALPGTFSLVSRASGPVFIFCTLWLIFGGTEGFGSHFHVFRSRTHFSLYRGHRVPFSCFVLPGTFSAVRRASGPGHVFRSHACLRARIQFWLNVLRSRTHFRRYRARRFPFSYFVLPDSFSAVPRVSGPVYMFCSPGVVSHGYRGCRVPFSSFALPNSFSTVPRASDPVFMFCALRLIFDGTEGVGSRFNVLRYQTHFSAMPSAASPVLMFC